jgi:hypothetical protein
MTLDNKTTIVTHHTVVGAAQGCFFVRVELLDELDTKLILGWPQLQALIHKHTS